MPGTQESLAKRLPRADGVHVVSSACGHDAFLVEFAQIAPVIGEFLRDVQP